MSFSEEMTNLGENLLHAAQNRKKDVEAVIGSTQRFLGNTRRERQENAKKQRQFLGKFVDDFSQKTQSMRSGFRKQHREMAKKQSNFLEDFTEKNRAYVGTFLGKCNKERMKFRGGLDQAHENFMHSMEEIEKLHGRSPSRRPTKGDDGETAQKASPKPGRKKRTKRRVS